MGLQGVPPTHFDPLSDGDKEREESPEVRCLST